MITIRISDGQADLYLDVPALLAGDLASVLTIGQAGIQTVEHAAFVERLRASSSSA